MDDAGTDKYLAERGRKLAGKSKPLFSKPSFSLAALQGLSFDRRNQLSASAIQRAWWAGSCLASCLHSAARE
jgi:hypothetical protein